MNKGKYRRMKYNLEIRAGPTEVLFLCDKLIEF